MSDDYVPPVWHGRVEGGKLILDEQNNFRAFFKAFEGQQIGLVVKKWRSQRSGGQNRYFHKIVVGMIAEAAGMDPAEAKLVLKAHFLAVDLEDGKLPRIPSTADLDTAQMARFIEDCRRLGAEMYGLNIPDPNSAGY